MVVESWLRKSGAAAAKFGVGTFSKFVETSVGVGHDADWMHSQGSASGRKPAMMPSEMPSQGSASVREPTITPCGCLATVRLQLESRALPCGRILMYRWRGGTAEMRRRAVFCTSYMLGGHAMLWFVFYPVGPHSMHDGTGCAASQDWLPLLLQGAYAR